MNEYLKIFLAVGAPVGVIGGVFMGVSPGSPNSIISDIRFGLGYGAFFGGSVTLCV